MLVWSKGGRKRTYEKWYEKKGILRMRANFIKKTIIILNKYYFCYETHSISHFHKNNLIRNS